MITFMSLTINTYIGTKWSKTVLYPLHILTNLIYTTTYEGRFCYHLDFADEKTEAQRVQRLAQSHTANKQIKRNINYTPDSFLQSVLSTTDSLPTTYCVETGSWFMLSKITSWIIELSNMLVTKLSKYCSILKIIIFQN